MSVLLDGTVIAVSGRNVTVDTECGRIVAKVPIGDIVPQLGETVAVDPDNKVIVAAPRRGGNGLVDYLGAKNGPPGSLSKQSNAVVSRYLSDRAFFGWLGNPSEWWWMQTYGGSAIWGVKQTNAAVEFSMAIIKYWQSSYDILYIPGFIAEAPDGSVAILRSNFRCKWYLPPSYDSCCGEELAGVIVTSNIDDIIAAVAPSRDSDHWSAGQDLGSVGCTYGQKFFAVGSGPKYVEPLASGSVGGVHICEDHSINGVKIGQCDAGGCPIDAPVVGQANIPSIYAYAYYDSDTSTCGADKWRCAGQGYYEYYGWLAGVEYENDAFIADTYGALADCRVDDDGVMGCSYSNGMSSISLDIEVATSKVELSNLWIGGICPWEKRLLRERIYPTTTYWDDEGNEICCADPSGYDEIPYVTVDAFVGRRTTLTVTGESGSTVTVEGHFSGAIVFELEKATIVWPRWGKHFIVVGSDGIVRKVSVDEVGAKLGGLIGATAGSGDGGFIRAFPHYEFGRGLHVVRAAYMPTAVVSGTPSSSEPVGVFPLIPLSKMGDANDDGTADFSSVFMPLRLRELVEAYQSLPRLWLTHVWTYSMFDGELVNVPAGWLPTGADTVVGAGDTITLTAPDHGCPLLFVAYAYGGTDGLEVSVANGHYTPYITDKSVVADLPVGRTNDPIVVSIYNGSPMAKRLRITWFMMSSAVCASIKDYYGDRLIKTYDERWDE